MTVLIDTNVILDFILGREPHRASADKIFEMIQQDELDAATTASCITDIYYVTVKHQGEDRARRAIRDLLDVFTIIDVNGDDCSLAMDLPIADFEDALVVICSYKVKIDYIVSNDKEFLQVDRQLAQVISADSFIQGKESL